MFGLSPYYGNAYLLNAAKRLLESCQSDHDRFPLPEPELDATIYAALSSEAYLNTALDLVLGRDVAAGLGRIPLHQRWILGPRLAFGNEVFVPGEEPHQTLVALARDRNRLLHARSIYTGWRADPEDRQQTHQDIGTVAVYILRVSQAVAELADLAPELEQLKVVPTTILAEEAMLASFIPEDHADRLLNVIKKARRVLIEDEHGTPDEWEEYFDPGDDPWSLEDWSPDQDDVDLG